MQALGMIETKGMIAAIESADAMLKAATVSLVEKTKVGGGLVTITITGDVAAVKAAVDAGAAAVQNLGGELLITQHVIARPHEELDEIFTPKQTEPEQSSEPAQQEPELPVQEELAQPVQEQQTDEPTQPTTAETLDRMKCDELFEQQGLEDLLNRLYQYPVVKLRNLARSYPEFEIAGRGISKANRSRLLREFRRWYGQQTAETQLPAKDDHVSLPE